MSLRRSRIRSSFTAPLLGLAAAALLSSCATTTRQAPEPASATAPAPVTRSGTAQGQAPAVPAQPQVSAAEANDINRDGQLPPIEQPFVEAAPEVTPPATNVVELNYEQEELRLVFERLGDALGINMVIDPTIDARVSLRTSPNNPLQFDDIWPLMRLLARNAGVSIVQAGDIWHFRRSAAQLPSEILLPQWLNDAQSTTVLQVTPLTYISVESALEILNPMLGGGPQQGQQAPIIRLGPGLIGISGSPEELTRVNALLEVVDSDPFLTQGIRLFELSNSPAAEVAEELRNVLTLIGGENSTYQILPLERINAVLVTAPANRGFEEVRRWVNVLDADSQGQGEQLFVYKVRNLRAPNLASTLTNVFAQDDDAQVIQLEDEEDLTDPDLIPLPTPSLPGSPSNAQGEQGQQGQGQGQQGGAQAQPGQQGAAAAPAGGPLAVSANLTVAIVADEDTNSLLIRATPREYQQLLATISALDGPPRQVLINAVIGQVTLTQANEFGVDWVRVSENAASGPARLSSRFIPRTLFDEETGFPLRNSGLVFTKSFMDGSAIIDATLNAIAASNEVTLLARPSLLVTNNQEGNIKVGQSVPVNAGNTAVQGGTIIENISYRDVGVELTITPQINEEGTLSLQIFQSLTSIQEGSSAGGIGGNPTFSNQEITTAAVVADQATVILGGLIQDEGQDQNSGIPLLKDIPGVGALFSYQVHSTARRELFVILHPQILRGDGTDAALMQDFRARFENVSALLRDAGL